MKSPEGTPADASTLIYLSKAGALRDAYAAIGPILVVPAVWYEAVEAGERKGATDPASIRVAHEQGLLRRLVLQAHEERSAAEMARRYRIGRGESEMLAVARNGASIFMDDGRATRVATALGYVPLPTVFIPVLACRRGTLERSTALDLLRRLAGVVAIRADDLMRLEADMWERRG